MSTKHYEIFEENLKEIEKNNLTDNVYLSKLLFANIITNFEVYLQNSFIELLSNDDKLIRKLTESHKYKNDKVTLTQALTNDMKTYITAKIKDLIFHNLSDIQPLYKEVLGVNINYKNSEYVVEKDKNLILNCIELRHDVVHRNGFHKNGKLFNFNSELVTLAIKFFKLLISDVDNQIVTKYYSN